MQLRLLNVAVDGGDMRVLLWGTGKRVAVAVHGITASGMSWQAVARHMPPDWTLAAPDLRGRGHSRDLPGPFGLDGHARDVVAVLRHFGGRPVLAGHSMGAYVALLARDAHPELVRRLVLVDGGLQRLTRPTPLLTAPAGMFGAPPPLIPHDVVQKWQERVPVLRPQVVPGMNHYTLLFDREGAAAVSQAIRAAAL